MAMQPRQDPWRMLQGQDAGAKLVVSLWVALGSALGGLARYWVGAWVQAVAGAAFPWGTLLINVVGSFVIGLVAAGIAERGWAVPAVDLRAFVMVGVCGGFTTFSSFSLQTLELLNAGRVAAALAYIGGSVVLCLVATGGGIVLGRGW